MKVKHWKEVVIRVVLQWPLSIWTFTHTLEGAAFDFSTVTHLFLNRCLCFRPSQIETCTECASPLVGLLKSSRQPPNFHFTKPHVWFTHCLQPSVHSLPGFPSHTGCSWLLFQWPGIAAMIRVIVISLFTFILWKEGLKKSPGDFNNSSSTL